MTRRLPFALSALFALLPACRGCRRAAPPSSPATPPPAAPSAPAPAARVVPPPPKWERKVQKLPALPKEVELAQIVISFKGCSGPWASVGAAAKRSRAQAKELAGELAQRARSGEDFAELAAKYSDWPFASQKVSPAYGGRLGIIEEGTAGLLPALAKAPFELSVGQVSEPLLSGFGFHVLKRLPALRAREIVISHDGAGWRHAPRSHAEALAIAQKVEQELAQGASFEKEAFDHSDDLATAGRGGDLGLFDDRSGVMPLIRDTVHRLSVGQVSAPLDSPIGLLILERTE
ncbi:MAG: peptidylprolyl isomerase [Deltaproteobacteria bacterium]